MTSTGIKSGGVYGALRMLQAEMKKFSGYFPIVCFDRGLSKRRLELYPDYKCNISRQEADALIAAGLAEGVIKAPELAMDANRLGLQLYCETLFIAPDGALIGMALMMSVVPMLCLIGSYLLIKNKYIISEEKYDEILQELEARKEVASE